MRILVQVRSLQAGDTLSDGRIVKAVRSVSILAATDAWTKKQNNRKLEVTFTNSPTAVYWGKTTEISIERNS